MQHLSILTFKDCLWRILFMQEAGKAGWFSCVEHHGTSTYSKKRQIIPSTQKPSWTHLISDFEVKALNLSCWVLSPLSTCSDNFGFLNDKLELSCHQWQKLKSTEAKQAHVTGHGQAHGDLSFRTRGDRISECCLQGWGLQPTECIFCPSQDCTVLGSPSPRIEFHWL